MKRKTIGTAVIATLLGVAVLVAITVVTRTFMVAAPVVAGPPPPPPVDSNLVAQHLSQAIKFQTVSYGDGVKEKERDAAVEELYLWAERTYRYFHEQAPQEAFGSSHLFVWRGTDSNLPPILLMAHLDVVPVVPGTEKDWMHAPFSGDIADGFVWGRGAIDNKSAAIALLEAGERLAAANFSPKRTIMFAFGHDEEVGGNKGNAAIAKALQARGVHFAWVVDEGSSILKEPYPGVRKPIAFVSVAEKGYLSLELTAHGQGGHAARPSENLALDRLSSAIHNVVDHPFVSDLDDIQRAKLSVLAPYVPFGERLKLANLWLMKPLVVRDLEGEPESAAILHTTISPTIMQAGVKDNVIPPTARAIINFRLHQRDTISSVTQHVKDAISDPQVDVKALMESNAEASKIVDLKGPAYTFVAQAIKDSLAVPVAPDLMTGATDSTHYLSIADAILRFRPFTAEPGDLPRVHGTNERVAVEDLGPAVGFYMRLIQASQ